MISVAIGAACGALLRWAAGLLLNHIFPPIPLGTLAVNVLGGFLMGLAVSYLACHPSWNMGLRHLIMTGFLGGLTAFSAFAAEVVDLLLHGEYLTGVISILMHVGGTITAVFLGIAAFAAI